MDWITMGLLGVAALEDDDEAPKPRPPSPHDHARTCPVWLRCWQMWDGPVSAPCNCGIDGEGDGSGG